jgi:hypothetical protein
MELFNGYVDVVVSHKNITNDGCPGIIGTYAYIHSAYDTMQCRQHRYVFDRVRKAILRPDIVGMYVGTVCPDRVADLVTQ